jgi:hypothetical protein
LPFDVPEFTVSTGAQLMSEPDIGDFLGRKGVLEEHGTEEITTWLRLSSQVFSLL